MSKDNTVSFTRMDHGTTQDYVLLEKFEDQYRNDLPTRLMERLSAMDTGLSGYQVSRLEHSLQTATRARRDGADADWVVAALLHDIGDELAPQNHDTMAAAIVAPYVREECSWAVQHHGIFQLKYYGEKVGLDPDARDAYRGHKHYAWTERFCERWDQLSFDPNYDSDDLESFAGDLASVFARKAWDEGAIREGYVSPTPK
jgi:predicted HD phosphohydrolase